MKRVNARRVKIHRSYAVDEAARLLDVHKNTVRNWIKSGLPTVDERRPILILGRSLSTFLSTRRMRRRQPCQPDQLYCFRCQAPKRPATGGRLHPDHAGVGKPSGDLRGLFDSHVPEGELVKSIDQRGWYRHHAAGSDAAHNR